MKHGATRRLFRLAFLALCTVAASAPLRAAEVQYESLTDLADRDRTIDMLWWPPDEGAGPWPTILFVHGYQPPDPDTGTPPGARAMLETPPRYPLFNVFRDKGYLVAAVSQAGYGKTDGPMDFCGPLTQRAIRTAVASLRSNPNVLGDQVFLHGRSRGAVASSMAATKRMGLAGVILESGVYDLKSEYGNLLRKGDERSRAIARNIRLEAGTTEEAFLTRSLLLINATIPAPILLLHGEEDSNTPVEHAQKLYDYLKQRDRNAILITIPDAAHHIPVDVAEAAIDLFIRHVNTEPPEPAPAVAASGLTAAECADRNGWIIGNNPNHLCPDGNPSLGKIISGPAVPAGVAGAVCCGGRRR